MTLTEKILNVVRDEYELSFSYNKPLNALVIVMTNKRNNMSTNSITSFDDLFDLNVLNEDFLINLIDKMILRLNYLYSLKGEGDGR